MPGAVPRSSFPTEDQNRTLGRLFNAIDAFRAEGTELSIEQAQLLVLVALNEGASLRDLQEKTQWRMSTMSRYLLDLGARNRKMEPGFGLIDSRQSPLELRRNEYRLTPKGREVLSRVLRQLQG